MCRNLGQPPYRPRALLHQDVFESLDFMKTTSPEMSQKDIVLRLTWAKLKLAGNQTSSFSWYKTKNKSLIQ